MIRSKIAPSINFLSIDIGGSHIKASIFNENGEFQIDYNVLPTPSPGNPENIINTIKNLVKSFHRYDLVSVGFPGYVKKGVIKTAPNLGSETWSNYNLVGKIETELGKPARVVNDADMHGLGVASGKGLEMVVTLGTGFGTALLLDGILIPHLEISHFPIFQGMNYDNYIGNRALIEEGVLKWNRRVKKVLKVLKTVINYDYLFIGGGNSDKLNFKLDKNVKIVSNEDGIKGGIRLWGNTDGVDDLTASAHRLSKMNS
jgi:polyphosphate glucokinase